MTNSAPEPKTIPMPLWLQGIVEALTAVFISAAIVVIPTALMWLTGAFARMSLSDAAASGAYIWFSSFGVPVEFLSPTGDETIGIWQFTPLGLLLVWLWLARRTGNRLARASRLKDLWQPSLGVLASWTFFTWGTTSLVSHDTIKVSQTAAILIPTAVFVAGYFWGVARYFRQPIAAYVGTKVDTLPDAARNTFHYLWALLRASIMSLAGAWAIASIMLTIQVGIHWAGMTDISQRLEAGILGGFIMVLIQIAMLPNMAAWTLSYLTGAGFAVGSTEVSPAGTLLNSHPALPIFAAIPVEQDLSAHWWMLLLLAAAGLVAGWWFFHVGENHLEDFLVAKIPHHMTAVTVAVVVTGMTIGVAAGILCLGVMWWSSGNWAFGSLVEVGAPIWLSSGLFAVHIGVSSAIGYALAPLRDRPLLPVATHNSN